MCCITLHGAGILPLDAGVDLLGFGSKLPGGPGMISHDEQSMLV